MHNTIKMEMKKKYIIKREKSSCTVALPIKLLNQAHFKHGNKLVCLQTFSTDRQIQKDYFLKAVSKSRRF